MDEQDETVVDLRDAPVGMDLELLGNHDSVLTALANYFERQGHETHQLWLGDLGEGVSAMFDLYVPDLKLLCEVETIDTLIGLDPHHFLPWREAGYEVWVVGPRDKLSLMARRVRNAVDRVIPWSANGPKITFEEVSV